MSGEKRPPPGPPPETTLTSEQKLCLLRASRRHLRQLQDELYRLQQLNVRHMAGPIQATEAEIECLGAAISWLWNHRGGP